MDTLTSCPRGVNSMVGILNVSISLSSPSASLSYYYYYYYFYTIVYSHTTRVE